MSKKGTKLMRTNALRFFFLLFIKGELLSLCQPAGLRYVHTASVSFSCRLKLSVIVWTATAKNWNMSFTHVKHRAGAASRQGLIFLLPILTPDIFPAYSLPLRSKTLFTLQQSVAHNQSNTWRSTFDIGAAQRRYVTDGNRTKITLLMCEQKQ